MASKKLPNSKNPNSPAHAINNTKKLRSVQISASDLQNPATLFQRYTVEEINEIESKIRNDIETKREDLRQMVGERYREIIMAADTIEEMHNCSRDIVNSLSSLRSHYKKSIKPMAMQASEAYLQHTITIGSTVEKSENSEKEEVKKGRRSSNLLSDYEDLNSWRKAFHSENSSYQNLSSEKILLDRQNNDRKTKLFQMACNSRILIELSDIINKAVNSNKFFQAVELCYLGRQCKEKLSLETTESTLLETIPCLTRPFQKLEEDIVFVKEKCLAELKDPEISLDLAVDASSALVLLQSMLIENNDTSSESAASGTAQALHFFIQKRLEFINETFNDTASYSVKHQASLITEIIQNTIQMSYALFDDFSNVSSANPELVKLKSNLILKFIKSKSISKLALNQKFGSQTKLSSLFNKWEAWMSPIEYECDYIQKIEKEKLKKLNLNESFLKPLQKLMKEKTKTLFSSVQSIKALGNVRAAVWDTETKKLMGHSTSSNDSENHQNCDFYKLETEADKEKGKNADTIPEWALGLDDVHLQKPACLVTWLKLVEHLFGEDNWSEKSDVWLMFFNEIFLVRVNEIISVSYDSVLTETKLRLEKVDESTRVREEEKETENKNSFNCELYTDLSDHVFTSDKSANDWIFTETKNPNSANFDIIMKSYGFTTEVQHLCKYVNKAIQKISADIFFCLDQLDSYPGNTLEIRLLNRFKNLSNASSDASLANKTKVAMCNLIKDLCGFISGKIELGDQSRSYVLFLIRVCEALNSESLSQDIRKTLIFEKKNTKDQNSSNISSFTFHGHGHGHNSSGRLRKLSSSRTPYFDEVRKILKLTTNKGLEKWTEITTKNLDIMFAKELVENHKSQNMTNICTWLELDGQNGLKIPSQTSINLHQLLGRVCNILNKSDAHAFKKSVIKKFCEVMAVNLISAYKNFMKNDEVQKNQKMSQYFAVQHLFDIKFIKLLFDLPKDHSDLLMLEKWLQEFIDPFDFDIISSQLDKYVTRSLARVSIMYGVINQNKSSSSLLKSSSSTVPGQEIHSVLELNASSAASVDGAKRIQMLPISIDVQMFMKNTKTQSRLPERLKSQLTFGNIYDSQERGGGESGLTSKLFGMFM